jgi:glycosyltransferase involved in cell wall biosynthesis
MTVPVIRVLHVAQPLGEGVPTVVSALVKGQVAAGWRVSVACPPASELTHRSHEAGATVLAWEARRAPGPSTLSETARLARVVRRVRPDLVHLHSSKAGLAGRLALRGRLPTVFQPHAWSFLAAGRMAAGARAWERLGARWADRIVCVSEDERASALVAGVDGRWSVVPNGIDLEHFPPAGAAERTAARRALALSDRPLAVTVGRLCAQKGQDLLLSAWPSVLDHVPGATLALVGDGPDATQLRSGAPDSVHFVGRRDDIATWLAAADVVVLPSRWEAGLSLAAMEAMGTARSVVVTDAEGSHEVLDAAAGDVVGLADPAALAAAVSRRLLDGDLAGREGTAGRRHVEARHDVRASIELVRGVYEDVLTAREIGL